MSFVSSEFLQTFPSKRSLTDEVVTGVADDQTDVVLPSKVDTGLNVFLRLRVDHVHTVVAKAARARGVIGNKTLSQ